VAYDRLGMVCANTLNLVVNRLGVVCANATATLNLIRFGVRFVVVPVDLRTYVVSLPEGRREFSYFALYR
jgi:hypothetical protein